MAVSQVKEQRKAMKSDVTKIYSYTQHLICLIKLMTCCSQQHYKRTHTHHTSTRTRTRTNTHTNTHTHTHTHTHTQTHTNRHTHTQTHTHTHTHIHTHALMPKFAYNAIPSTPLRVNVNTCNTSKPFARLRLVTMSYDKVKIFGDTPLQLPS